MTEAQQVHSSPCEGTSLDAASFEHCLRANLPALTRYTRSLARDDNFAQDLVQETSFLAWRARARFASGNNFQAWCRRILKNCFLTHMRRLRIAQIESSRDHMPETAVAPVQGMVIELQEVGHAWGQLTAGQQRSFGLVALEGLSYEEAALVEGVALGTIKSWMSRARQALVALMDPATHLIPCEKAPVTSDVESQADTVPIVPPRGSSEVFFLQAQMLRAWHARRPAAEGLSLAA